MKIPDRFRTSNEWNELKRLFKLHICIFNDLKSRNKEKGAGITENLMLILEKNSVKPVQQAATEVVTELNSLIREIEMLEVGMEATFKHFKMDPSECEIVKKAIQAMKDCDVGHIIWESVSFRGRHVSLPSIDPTLVLKHAQS